MLRAAYYDNLQRKDPAPAAHEGRYDAFLGPMPKFTEQEFVETAIKPRKKQKPKRKEVLASGFHGCGHITLADFGHQRAEHIMGKPICL